MSIFFCFCWPGLGCPQLVTERFLLAFTEAIHANHASAVIDRMFFSIDAGRFTMTCTKSALIAFFRIYCDAEQGVT